MQRSLFIFCLALSMICFIPRSQAQKGKSELSIGYGRYSFYSFLNVNLHYNAGHSNSSGTTVFTYRYYVSKNTTLGMSIGYENISTWGSFVTFAPELTTSYLDTRNTMNTRVRLYGLFSYGVSVFGDGLNRYGHVDESGPKPWAFQATPIGMRVGRQVAFYLEAGFGYKGILHGGVEIRVPRTFSHKQHAD
ncbi:MAG: hypothetical protein JWQ38_1008 [Flavipsychrobacter sp.]|nr:hypothetical protein [Flavipsychrobacter sp.]